MIVTDAMPEADGRDDVAGAQWVAVGAPVANVGIIAAERDARAR